MEEVVMSLRRYIGLAGILAILGGFPYIFFPVQAIGFFGLVTDDPGIIMTRFFGAAFLSFGVVLWFVRDAIDPDEHKFILTPLMICGLISALVALTGMLSGLLNNWGWLVLALNAGIGLGFGYFYRQ